MPRFRNMRQKGFNPHKMAAGTWTNKSIRYDKQMRGIYQIMPTLIASNCIKKQSIQVEIKIKKKPITETELPPIRPYPKSPL